MAAEQQQQPLSPFTPARPPQNIVSALTTSGLVSESPGAESPFKGSTTFESPRLDVPSQSPAEKLEAVKQYLRDRSDQPLHHVEYVGLVSLLKDSVQGLALRYSLQSMADGLSQTKILSLFGSPRALRRAVALPQLLTSLLPPHNKLPVEHCREILMASTNGRVPGAPAHATDIKAQHSGQPGQPPQNSSSPSQIRHLVKRMPRGDVLIRSPNLPHLMVPASPHPQPRHVSNLTPSLLPCPLRVVPHRLIP